jgi:CHAT domain-containing protein
MSAVKRRWKLIPLAAAILAIVGLAASVATARSTAASPIKIAVLSDCQGAFGSFDNQDLAGVVAAMVQFAGAR